MTMQASPGYGKRIMIGLISCGTVFCASFAYSQNTQSANLYSLSEQSFVLSDADQVGLDLENDMTLEMWVKIRDMDSSERVPLLFKREGSGNQRSYSWYIFDVPGGKTINFDYSGNGANGSAHEIAWLPSLHTWHHLAVVKDDLSLMFYVNGEQVGPTQTGAFPEIFDSNAPVEIGSWTNENFDMADFDGLIDEVRVWNVARTATEVNQHKDHELSGTEPGLVGYWRFNGGSLADATVNGNDLTNVNGAMFSSDVPFSDDPPPLSPVEQAQSLISTVTDLDLPKHITNMYLANLTKVPRFIEEGKNQEALNQLIAFVAKVQRHQSDGQISEAVAEDLLDRAETLMLALI